MNWLKRDRQYHVQLPLLLLIHAALIAVLQRKPKNSSSLRTSKKGENWWNMKSKEEIKKKKKKNQKKNPVRIHAWKCSYEHQICYFINSNWTPSTTVTFKKNSELLFPGFLTGKPGKMREVFPVRKKSRNFKILPESQGKVREFCMSQGKLD